MGRSFTKAMRLEDSFIRLVKNAPAYRRAGICGVALILALSDEEGASSCKQALHFMG
jgi:hypothetical protein